MGIIALIIFIGTCYMAYQLGQYEGKYGGKDK